MKVLTDYAAARELAEASKPLFYSHISGVLFERHNLGSRTEFVFGRRYPGLFDANDGSYIVVETAGDGDAKIDRDSYGAIPLFYSTVRLVISTDLRLILETEQPGLDLDGLAEYLSASYLAGGKTIYRNVRCLMPNECLVVKNDEAIVSRKDIFPPATSLGGGELQRQLEAAIDNSVDDLLRRYPGKVLLNLSGGADSTLLLAKIRGRDPHKEIVTTTYFHEDWRDDLNDWEYAAEAAKKYGSDHHLTRINNETFCRAHQDLMWKAKNVFHTYAAAFYLQNKSVPSVTSDVPIINGSGPDESIIGTEKVPLPDLLELRGMNRSDWSAYLIDNIDYLKMTRSAVAAVMRESDGDFVERRKAVAADLLDAPDFVEFQRRYHMLTVLQDHIQELSSVAQVLGSPILFPYLTNDIFRIVFAAKFEALNEGQVYKSIVKETLAKYMPRRFVYRKKIGFQSPSRPYFKSEEPGLGRELVRLLGRRTSAVLNMASAEEGIRERLSEELNLHRRYDFLEWTVYNILRLEENRGADG